MPGSRLSCYRQKPLDTFDVCNHKGNNSPPRREVERKTGGTQVAKRKKARKTKASKSPRKRGKVRPVKKSGPAAKKASRRSATASLATAGLAARTGRVTTSTQVYDRLIICLSRITGFGVHEIAATDNLANKFKFNQGGLVALAQALERCFENAGMKIPGGISRPKIQQAKTVLDIANLLIDAFQV